MGAFDTTVGKRILDWTSYSRLILPFLSSKVFSYLAFSVSLDPFSCQIERIPTILGPSSQHLFVWPCHLPVSDLQNYQSVYLCVFEAGGF